MSISEFLKPIESSNSRGWRGPRGTDFRNGDRTAESGPRKNLERRDSVGRVVGELKSNGSRSVEVGVLKNKDEPEGGGGKAMQDGAKILIEDQEQFPVLKSAARAV